MKRNNLYQFVIDPICFLKINVKCFNMHTLISSTEKSVFQNFNLIVWNWPCSVCTLKSIKELRLTCSLRFYLTPHWSMKNNKEISFIFQVSRSGVSTATTSQPRLIMPANLANSQLKIVSAASGGQKFAHFPPGTTLLTTPGGNMIPVQVLPQSYVAQVGQVNFLQCIVILWSKIWTPRCIISESWTSLK